MADRNDFCVDGYRFASLEDAEQAQIEKKKAAYFESKLQEKNAQGIMAAYDKILDEKVFTTPIGWEYLRYLQDKLRALGVEQQVRPIPVYISFPDEDHAKAAEAKARPTQKKDQEKRGPRVSVSVILNLLLLLLVIVMFVITLDSNNPNILNYKKVITNEYAAWDQELTERENRIREKEAELFTD